MSWSNLFGLSGTKEKRVPALNALEQQRLKQIESLKRCHQNVTEIQKDVEFKITFFIEGNAVNLHVFLPPNFPHEIPVVRVSPAMTHPWVNNQMVVTGCDSLNKFYMHSNLGRALQDVCKQFLDHPPIFVPYNTHAAVTSSSQSYTRPTQDVPTSVTTASVEAETAEDSSSSSVDRLDGYLKITTKLEDCSIDELRDLDDHPEKLMELIDADLINSNVKNREDQMIRIEEIAKTNVEQRQKLDEVRKRLVDKYDKLCQLRASFDKWSSMQNDLFEMHTPDNLHLALQLGVSEMDEKSEKDAEEFLNENLAIEEFIKCFLEKRKLTHIRRWKQENVLRL
ncbi:vacuolar protein sorting-associated protein 37A-like [Dendronephthya gigantea]|uniref:vacuolar protein sorting-associated protein 37A-like n=1 Tax=Dendronephthya gigantea TaxID=151771 RepID=UPI00106B2B11|nr:vacuolar protein sorting-associated protein 37A-like [Dendronephthya gigantea]